LLFSLMLLFIVLVAGISLVICTTGEPPVEEITLARETINLAKQELAGKYASETLKRAENLYDQSFSEWRYQNSRFFILRDYSYSTDLASRSYSLATTALDEAVNSKIKLKQSTDRKLNSLVQRIEKFDKYYRNLALNHSTIKLINRVETRLLEAQIEYKKNEFLKALKLIYQAEEDISQAEKSTHLRLTGFYRNYPEWEKNAKTAYKLSKNGITVLLVDKMESSLTVLRSGREYKTFSVEFGDNWMDDKTTFGDKATPEGIYKIKAKKSGSKTKYFKALLLDYPNREDRQRFTRLVNEGKIPKGSNMGGLIEIHGEGAKGMHWTDGCIALENSEMDLIYKLCEVNTPVIIVGSRQLLEDYLN